MKHFGIFIWALALMAFTSCNLNDSKADGHSPRLGGASVSESVDPFVAFAEHFSETASFAYADVGGHRVLLVSQETFGNDASDSKEAIEATVFVLDSVGKIITLGSVRSQGTLYPVSLLDGRLMVAGHHFVRIYSIRGEGPELVLDSFQEGDGPELAEMYRTFEKGTSIKFKKNRKEL